VDAHTYASLALAIAGGLVVVPLACVASSGTPAAPYAVVPASLEAGPTDVAVAAPPPPTVFLAGNVHGAGTDAGVSGAIVFVEVGGLEQVGPLALGPDGGLVPTTAVNPFVRFGAVTDVSGRFLFAVPAGVTGLHTLDSMYLEQLQTVDILAPADGPLPTTLVALTHLASDAGVTLPPTVTGLTATPSLVAPLTSVMFAMNVAAGSAEDPLSDAVFLVQPETEWAGALAPPTPAVPGGKYPDGIYNRLVQSPATPGVYTYTAVAASTQKRCSAPVSIVLTVTPTGSPPIPDASFFDGEVFSEGGGLPDGRH